MQHVQEQFGRPSILRIVKRRFTKRNTENHNPEAHHEPRQKIQGGNQAERGWNWITARPSAAVRGSAFQA